MLAFVKKLIVRAPKKSVALSVKSAIKAGRKGADDPAGHGAGHK